MKFNNQKRWEKVYLGTIGLVIYSVLTAFSYSNSLGGTFPSNPTFQQYGLVWEGPEVNESEDMTFPDYTLGGNIHGKVLSNIPGSYWGSVDGYYGIVINPDMVFMISGLSNAQVSSYRITVQYDYQNSPKATGSYSVNSVENSSGIYKYSSTFTDSYIRNIRTGQTYSFKATNIRAALYVRDSVKSQQYSYNGDIWLEVGAMRIYLVTRPTFTISQPILCTINTPPKIDFGKVNIWEWEGNTSGTPGGNRKDVLGSIDGNFTINCTGDNNARTPAKLTIKGTIQGFANDLKMTMDTTGEVAPATIRASIKSIYAPCSSSGIYFSTGNKTPPGNEVDLGELTVGQNSVPYRFSLCALGEGFKSGAASASATVTIDWE